MILHDAEFESGIPRSLAGGQRVVRAGTATICCNAPFARRMSSHLLGTEHIAVNEDILAAVKDEWIVVPIYCGGAR